MRSWRNGSYPRLLALSLFFGFMLAMASGAWAISSDEPADEPQVSKQEQAQEVFRHGNDLRDHGNPKAAIKAYRQALKLHKEFPEACNNLGYTLRLTGEYNDAIKSYKKALKLRPDFPEAHEYIGKAYIGLGKIKEARKHLLKLQQLGSPLAVELQQAINAQTSRR